MYPKRLFNDSLLTITVSAYPRRVSRFSTQTQVRDSYRRGRAENDARSAEAPADSPDRAALSKSPDQVSRNATVFLHVIVTHRVGQKQGKSKDQSHQIQLKPLRRPPHYPHHRARAFLQILPLLLVAQHGGRNRRPKSVCPLILLPLFLNI